jgi:hypothetical protein
VDCDVTQFEDADLWMAMVIQDDQSFTCKSLCRGILVVVCRLRSIFRLTTTNQEVAGSSPAGPATFPNKIDYLPS